MKSIASLLRSPEPSSVGERVVASEGGEDRVADSSASTSSKWGILRARSMRRIPAQGEAAQTPGTPRPLSIRRISEVALNKVRSGMAGLSFTGTASASDGSKRKSSMRKSRRATSKDEQQLAKNEREGDVRAGSARLSAAESHSPEFEPVNVQAGGASCRGKSKRANEDRLTVLAHLVQDDTSNKNSVGFAAVFDGHGGDKCVEHISLKLPTYIGHEIFQVMKEQQTDHWETITRAAMVRGVRAMDREVLDLCAPRRDVSGSCAVMATVRGCEVTIANVGDCRAIMFVHGEPNRVSRITVDHCVTNEDEIERIRIAGGKIIEERLGGVLAPTRAFGDADLKQDSNSGLIVDPEVYYIIANPGSVLVMCSDGVTNAFSDEQIAVIVQESFDLNGNDPTTAASCLSRKAADIGLDDSSAVIMLFQAQMEEAPL